MDTFLGKTFLVTGSSSGMGLATASDLLGQGARVVLHGYEHPNKLPPGVQQLLSEDNAHYLNADLAAPDSVESLAHEAVHWAGTLDGFVHCAALTSHRTWTEITVSEWDRAFAVNVRAAFLLSQHLAPALRRSRGAIVLVSSTHAMRVNRKNIVYDTSKAALNQLSLALALEFKTDGVRVNTVMPGGVNTPMLQNWLVDYTGSDLEAQALLKEGLDLGRIGQPNDIAQVITFLLSPASRWITGATVTADGGAILER